VLKEPLGPVQAKALIRAILEAGNVLWSAHALDEMEKDDLTRVDVVNVLRGGVVEPGEYERRSWRYRVHTIRIWVVVAFNSDTELVIVTTWRKAR
jgi:Domain of unknown function (DUF4258)